MGLMTKHSSNATWMSCLRQTASARTWGLALAALTVPWSSRAIAAPEPAHCRALKAEARSAAAVLELPRIEAQALHSPMSGAVDGTVALDRPGFQGRAGVAWSAIGLLHGRSLRTAAQAECDRWSAAEEIELVLRQGTSFGQAEALRAQIAAIEAGLPRVVELVEEARARFERSLITVLELDELELRRLTLEVTLGELRHELSLLDSQNEPHDADKLGEALARYERASRELEHEEARSRRLDAWKVDISGGLIPFPEPDWFGIVSVGWSFGGVSQPAAEAEAKTANEQARASSVGELRPRAEKFAAAMKESAVRLGDELILIDRQLELHARRLAERPDSERLRQAFASLEIGEIELRGRRVFVQRLRDARIAVGSLEL